MAGTEGHRLRGGKGLHQTIFKKSLDRVFQFGIVITAVSDSMTWLGSSVGRAED